MREWKYSEFTPTHEVRETDEEFWIDDKKIEGVGVDSVKIEPLGDNVIVTLSFLAKSYARN